MAGYQSVCKADDRYRSIWTDQCDHETGKHCWAPPPPPPPPPPHVLPDFIARDQISQAFPRRIHTGSDEILAVGMAWEWG